MSADDKPEPRPWLAAARERCNMSQEGLAHRLNVSAKTVGNWELGIYLPRIDVRADLAEALGFTLDELLRRFGCDVAPEPGALNGTVTPFARITEWLSMYERAERTAYAIWTLEMTTFPALTQTAGYARAVQLSGDQEHAPEEVEHLVKMRLARSDALATAEYTALVPVPLLDAVKGDHQVMAAQMAHLLALADRPNVTLRVIDYEHMSSAQGPFTLLATASHTAHPDTVAEFTNGEPVYSHSTVAVAARVSTFEHMRSLALDTESSRAVIAKSAGRYAAIAASMTKGTA